MNICFIDIGGTNIRYSFFYNNKRLSIKKKEIPVSKSFNQILNDGYQQWISTKSEDKDIRESLYHQQ